VVDTFTLVPLQHKRTVRFLIVLLHFWLLGLQHDHFMDFSPELPASHGAATRLSGAPALISEEFIREKR